MTSNVIDLRPRVGNTNATRKVADSSAPPWARWKVRRLDARCIKFIETQCAPVKGVGRGKPLKLARFQKEWISEVLTTDIDASVLTLPRGSGKSTFGGALATWALFDPVAAEAFGGAPSIPICATALKQAVRGVYGAALAFTKANTQLRSRSLIYSGSGEQRIVVPSNFDGECFPISSDVDGLQGLDPSLAVIDEAGFIDPAAWDALLLAGGKRERSLCLGLGTRRPDNEPNALDHLVAQLEEHGEIDRFLLVDYHAEPGCDLDDRAQWRRANPAIAAGFLRISALETARKLSPEASFRTFRLNQKSETLAGWLGTEGRSVWDSLRAPFTFGRQAIWVGIDVSHRHDSTAVAWCGHRPDGRRHVACRIWTPGPGSPIPFDEVEEHIRQLSLDHNVVTAAYDPRYFAATAQRLEAEGIVMEEVPQSHARMVPLVGECFRAIVAHSLTHDASTEFSSHVLNAVPSFGDVTGFSLSKKKSAQHIDAAVAMCLAVGSSVFVAETAPLNDDAMKVW